MLMLYVGIKQKEGIEDIRQVINILRLNETNRAY